ncbi:MAG: FKBP-type peptidyl-prolyl cis-trans isomerase [Monoraphidium minutum]|nr:MAG: FKBP-type peptidyl-prolyl cis-trans isomerase [Monoraphidium minutum]
MWAAPLSTRAQGSIGVRSAGRRASPAAAAGRTASARRPRAPPPRAAGEPQQQQPVSTATEPAADAEERPKQRRKAESTDAIASFLTRRFGLAGGLAWLGFLAVGTLGEQIKTRIQVDAEEKGARDVDGVEVALPSGVRYTDLRIGGGQSPSKGMLVVLQYVGKADGAVFEDTQKRGKPIVYIYGGRPFTGGLCAGVEEALSTMRAGGRRRVVVPPALGFGARGAVLRPTEHVPDKQGLVPPGATLEYEIELQRVSVPPS